MIPQLHVLSDDGGHAGHGLCTWHALCCSRAECHTLLAGVCPPHPSPCVQTQEGPRQEQAQPKQEQAPPPSHTAGVGASIKAPSRNPLDMIKRDVPLLSQPKQRQQQRPLSPLIDAAGRDESCVWYRVRQGVQWRP